MALVEIDEADLQRLRRQESLLIDAVRHPKLKKQLAGIVKELRPEDAFAKEADAVDPQEKRIDELQQALADEKKAREESDAKRDKDAKLGALQAEQDAAFARLRNGPSKWTEDGIAKVKKVMEDKGILDVDIAAKWVESQMPPQIPITPGGSGAWNFLEMPQGENEDYKKLIESKGENSSLLDKLSRDALADVRGSRR